MVLWCFGIVVFWYYGKTNQIAPVSITRPYHQNTINTIPLYQNTCEVTIFVILILFKIDTAAKLYFKNTSKFIKQNFLFWLQRMRYIYFLGQK